MNTKDKKAFFLNMLGDLTHEQIKEHIIEAMSKLEPIDLQLLIDTATELLEGPEEPKVEVWVLIQEGVEQRPTYFRYRNQVTEALYRVLDIREEGAKVKYTVTNIHMRESVAKEMFRSTGRRS